MNQDTHITLVAIGAAFAGGYYVGQIKSGDKTYALIMAGAEGELSGRWHPEAVNVPDAMSAHDGFANTEAMVAAGSKLAQRVRALNIAGFADWYIPSKDELELCYRNAKPSKRTNWEDEGVNENSVPVGAAYTPENPAQTTIPALQEDEPDALVPAWYWSSTQHADGSDYAWNQGFGSGDQYYYHKSYAGRARAVRRLPI
ncbi:DUF1566 domain-containing protein [Pseudoduganella sp. RAF19]|uniref:Lcl C-terminal domain-containing protein n=1 Tax=Bacteria TaxID=2 RepID=UPI003F9490E7